MPFEFIKKTMMTGVGIALKTQAEFEEMTKSFIEKSKMSEEEGKKFIEDMLEKYQEAKVKMEVQIEESVKKMFEKTDLANKKEVDALKTEVDVLKKEFEALKSLVLKE